MNNIIKRLELIKNSIALEDEEVIQLQIEKISTLTVDDTVANILRHLGEHNYLVAAKLIEGYIASKQGLVSYVDERAAALKLELKALEHKLQALAEVKHECMAEIEEFNKTYHLKLGPMIRDILSLKQAIFHQHIREKLRAFEAKKKAYEAIKARLHTENQRLADLEEKLASLDEFSSEYDDIYEAIQRAKHNNAKLEQQAEQKRQAAKDAKEALEGDPAKEQYEEAKSDSHAFDEEYEDVLKQKEGECSLTEEELKELKYLYRKAAKLCHPDIVADDLKDQAHEIMVQLNAARDNKDLARVKEILLSLESGKGFTLASDAIFNADILQAKIDQLRQDILSIENEITQLKTTDVYSTLIVLADKESYFAELYAKLNAECESLRNRLKELLAESVRAEAEQEAQLNESLYGDSAHLDSSYKDAVQDDNLNAYSEWSNEADACDNEDAFWREEI